MSCRRRSKSTHHALHGPRFACSRLLAVINRARSASRTALQQPPHEFALAPQAGLLEGALELARRGVAGDSAAIRIGLDGVSFGNGEGDLNFGLSIGFQD